MDVSNSYTNDAESMIATSILRYGSRYLWITTTEVAGLFFPATVSTNERIRRIEPILNSLVQSGRLEKHHSKGHFIGWTVTKFGKEGIS